MKTYFAALLTTSGPNGSSFENEKRHFPGGRAIESEADAIEASAEWNNPKYWESLTGGVEVLAEPTKVTVDQYGNRNIAATNDALASKNS